MFLPFPDNLPPGSTFVDEEVEGVQYFDRYSSEREISCAIGPVRGAVLHFYSAEKVQDSLLFPTTDATISHRTRGCGYRSPSASDPGGITMSVRYQFQAPEKRNFVCCIGMAEKGNVNQERVCRQLIVHQDSHFGDMKTVVSASRATLVVSAAPAANGVPTSASFTRNFMVPFQRAMWFGICSQVG